MYFILFKSPANNQWYWNLRAANNEKIAASEGYIAKQSALDTIRAVKAAAAGASIYDDSEKNWV
jgi:uncharacterized protein YegP (UPF0339 family)